MQSQGVRFFDESQRQSFNRGRAEGRAEYAANAVISVLQARDLSLSDGQRSRIESCTDLELLDRWIRRAATVSSTDELFE